MKNCRSWSTPRSARCGSTCPPTSARTSWPNRSWNSPCAIRTSPSILTSPTRTTRSACSRPATCPSRSANCPTRRRSRACWACCRLSVRVARVPGKHGEPKHPSDLTRHECIEFRAEGAGRVTRWPLNNGDQHIEFTPGNRFSVNGVAMARRLAMLGAGIAVLVGGQREKQRSGQLLRVLPDWQLGPFPSMRSPRPGSCPPRPGSSSNS